MGEWIEPTSVYKLNCAQRHLSGNEDLNLFASESKKLLSEGK